VGKESTRHTLTVGGCIDGSTFLAKALILLKPAAIASAHFNALLFERLLGLVSHYTEAFPGVQ